MGACLLGTYLIPSSGQCAPCYEACRGGCAGPLPYINNTHGCLGCDRVRLSREGRQVSHTWNGTIFTLLYSSPPEFLLQERCVSSGCTVGTYPSVLTTAIGDLGPGADVCIPCDPLCEVCVGPGTRLADCTVCAIAARTTEGCVESCNATSGEELEVLSDCMGFVVCVKSDVEDTPPHTEYFVPANRFCVPCASSCLGCTGLAFTDCLQCAPGFVKKYSNDRSS